MSCTTKFLGFDEVNTVVARTVRGDEAIRVEVRQLSSEDPLGSYCYVAAGGQQSPWSASVPFRGAPGQAVVVIASTGGHYRSVEQFAVTAVRPRD